MSYFTNSCGYLLFEDLIMLCFSSPSLATSTLWMELTLIVSQAGHHARESLPQLFLPLTSHNECANFYSCSVMPALQRLMAGGLYTFAFQISDLLLPDTYLLSASFQVSLWVLKEGISLMLMHILCSLSVCQNLSLLTKCLVVTIWGKLMLSKYVGCWLITVSVLKSWGLPLGFFYLSVWYSPSQEGACIMTGMTHNGQDENGNILWNGCANIHIRQYESASTGQEYIQAFNVNTNRWMAKYVFKRLKWVGNRLFSQVATLFFLALWHGLHSGYYNNFALEFFVVMFERDVSIRLSLL